jgi:hypothetical protein
VLATACGSGRLSGLGCEEGGGGTSWAGVRGCRLLGLALLQFGLQLLDHFGARFGTGETAVIGQHLGDLFDQHFIHFGNGRFARLAHPKGGKLTNAAHHGLVFVALAGF